MGGAIPQHTFELVWMAHRRRFFLLKITVEHTNLSNSVANVAGGVSNYGKVKVNANLNLAKWGGGGIDV
jgi:hypothetical protein